MARNESPLNVAIDPLPGLVECRFRLLSECAVRSNQNDGDAFSRRVDEALRRRRRLDEQIVRTMATSTSGLLAQLRLLSAFYDESTNGMGRRGVLLIQSIAHEIKRLDGVDSVISPDPKTNATDRICSSRSEMEETLRLQHSSFEKANGLVINQCHCLHVT
jgi:hypothetical protein